MDHLPNKSVLTKKVWCTINVYIPFPCFHIVHVRNHVYGACSFHSQCLYLFLKARTNKKKQKENCVSARQQAKDGDVTCNNFNIFSEGFDTSLTDLTFEMLDEAWILLVQGKYFLFLGKTQYSFRG